MINYKQENSEINGEATVERVEANVKWYNPEKNYGFLVRDDGSGDIMIHLSALVEVGYAYIWPGDRVLCDVASGQAGSQVVRIIEVRLGSPESRFLSGVQSPFELYSLQECEGTIKWYNPNKGFGFIHPKDEGKEIFLHASVACAAGYKALLPGIRVFAKVSQAERGPIARMIKVIYEEQKQASSHR